jgi:DNA invertase Pin-like site-specific DNA recombinase
MNDHENDMQRAVGQTSGTVAVSQYKTVNLKGYKLGQDGRIVKGRKPKIERNQRVIRFYEAGIEPKQISEWMKISVQQVRKIIRRGY